jgi:hypothetical protein
VSSLKSDPPPQPGALVPRPRSAAPQSDDITLQRLWLAMIRREWRSLAVIGGSKGLPTIEVANLMAQMAWWYRGESSCVFDFRDVGLRLVDHQIQTLQYQMQTEQGDRAIIALRSVFENPTAVPFAQAVDAVVLCVGIGATDMASAEKTIVDIGRERFLGSIIIDGSIMKKIKK